MRQSILPEPLQPDALRACPACGRYLALKLESKLVDEHARELHTYRCKHCGYEITYADRHPPHVV